MTSKNAFSSTSFAAHTALFFDLVFLILDRQDGLNARRLATHFVSMYYADQQDEEDSMFVGA